MTSGKGIRNLVSQHTDDINWRIARKGIAPAFAQKNIKYVVCVAGVHDDGVYCMGIHVHHRAAFTVVQEMALRLCARLSQDGTQTYQDMDNLLLRETIDIISKWGFKLDMHCIEVLYAR